MIFNNLIPALGRSVFPDRLFTLLIMLGLIGAFTPLRSHAQGTNVFTGGPATRALTNVVTVVTNGATTFAGATNTVIQLVQGEGLAFQFSALATNAGQLTYYLSPSVDGVNFVDISGSWIWGNTLNASGWITRATNIPNSVTDNYQKVKLLVVSNSAAYLVISNANFGRRTRIAR